mmetsp:Transcript_29056/g.54371  ORF Transcript_29056/g.54371 Transcript_29056/m.54371 type:complete len:203 (-) Transcript_29056:156-764(-)|eukprot:CAMPEP_0170186694 /NCGR_PEP_ID=MMETSP0040_2-20121228/39949_1 /TAXON_ID=641309 /ORGANISM="Lotharella oceanica, Strain CCMP622" /LENGTH=202 /DNA_ID=CAMNT_0010433539 /DNA_START=25 /DNA_END=633 /DNA_ORIENTATION=-
MGKGGKEKSHYPCKEATIPALRDEGAGAKALELCHGKIIKRHREELRKLRGALAGMHKQRAKKETKAHVDPGKKMRELFNEFDQRCMRELKEVLNCCATSAQRMKRMHAEFNERYRKALEEFDKEQVSTQMVAADSKAAERKANDEADDNDSILERMETASTSDLACARDLEWAKTTARAQPPPEFLDLQLRAAPPEFEDML